jgi:hypothetical protein
LDQLQRSQISSSTIFRRCERQMCHMHKI